MPISCLIGLQNDYIRHYNIISVTSQAQNNNIYDYQFCPAQTILSRDSDDDAKKSAGR